MMAELDYDELQRLADAATPGEWVASPGGYVYREEPEIHDRFDVLDTNIATAHESAADAEFIAASRSAVPNLLDRVRELEAADDIGSETIVRVAMERDAALSTIAKVREVHSPKSGENPRYAPDDYHAEREPIAWVPYTVCTGCSAGYPCPTIRALGSVPSTGEGNE